MQVYQRIQFSIRLKVIIIHQLLMVEAVVSECLLYLELAEIFAQNAVLNPPFIHIPGVIEPVENKSDLEPDSQLSSIPEWHTPSKWEDLPLNPRVSSDSPRIPSPVGNFNDNSNSLELPSDWKLPVDELVSHPTVHPRSRPSQ